MQPHRAVHRGDQRHLDVENVHEDFPALAIDLVVALRSKEVEAFRADSLHERLPLPVRMTTRLSGSEPICMKQVDELFVGMSIEDQCAPVSVKRHFQHAGLRTGQASIGKAVAIGIKAAHRFAPWESRRRYLIQFTR